MKKYQIKNMTVDELKATLDKLYVQLLENKFKKKLGGLTNVKLLRNIRKDIARIKTYLKLKQKENK